MGITEENRVLVIGDIMLDIISLGKVERFAPNLHIPVLCYKEEKKFLGGAANVFNNIHAMNILCDLCGCVANDANGEYVIAKINELSKKNFVYKYNKITTTKLRYMEYSGEEFIRVDNEEKSKLTDEQYALIENQIAVNIARYKIVIFSDYNKGFLKKKFIQNIIKICKNSGVTVIVDTKTDNLNMYKGCDILKVNKNDLLKNGILDVSQNEMNKIIEIVKELENPLFIMTAGDANITFLDRALRCYSFKPKNVVAKDTTGAGDVFLSALAAKLCESEDIFQAIDYAKNMCSFVVQKLGTSVVEEKMKSTKLIDRKYISDYIKKYRENGKSIVFVNGCFDILHVGHISLLKWAKKRGDILIVGLNSDESIRQLKGKHRPIINEQQRCIMLSAIEDVDHIILYNQTTPCELIDIIKPDVVCKGEEYEKKDFLERKQILLYEGKIDYYKNTHKISTSDIINRITNIME